MHICVSEKKICVGFGHVPEDRVCLFRGAFFQEHGRLPFGSPGALTRLVFRIMYLETRIVCFMALFPQVWPFPLWQPGLGFMVSVLLPANGASILPKVKYTAHTSFLAVQMSGRREITSRYVVGSRVGGNDGEA